MDRHLERAAPPTDGETRSSRARITVMIESRLVVEAGAATGRELKELAGIPVEFALHRRARGGNEAVHDDDIVDVRNGDHFFARPLRDGRAHR